MSSQQTGSSPPATPAAPTIQESATPVASQAAKDQQNNELQAQVNTIQVRNDTLDTRVIQTEAGNRALQAEKGALSARNAELEAQIHTLKAEGGDMTGQIDQLEARIRGLEVERDAFDEECGQHEANIRELEGRVQRLENRCDEQTEQNHQQSDKITELNSDLVGRDNTLQETIKRADTEMTSSLQQIQQLQHFLFSKMLLVQHDQTVSLSTSGYRLLLKRQRQQLSHDTPAQWIQGPLKETMDTMTNSTEISNLAETYQLVLGSLTYLQSSIHFQDKESLLECLEKFQTWLTKACKGRTSILGLALARVVKTIQEGPQSNPWFSIDKFNSIRMIDASNSELPETTAIIGDGFAGIILLVEGADTQVCQATDIFMRQQRDYGVQLVFDEALGLPDLQLLADSFPNMDRCQPLEMWAVKVGRFNLVKRSGRVYKPEEFE